MKSLNGLLEKFNLLCKALGKEVWVCGNITPKQIKTEIKFSRNYREDSLVDVSNHQNEISFGLLLYNNNIWAKIRTGKPETKNNKCGGM